MRATVNTWISILVFAALCYGPGLLYFENLPDEMMLSPTLLPFIIAAFFLLRMLKYTLNKWVILIWLWFFPLGILNIHNSYVKDNFWRLGVNEGSFIYFIYLVAFIVLLLLFERAFPKKKVAPGEMNPTILTAQNPQILNIVFLIFPILWIADLFRNVGYIPILSGISIVDNIYELDYGPLYSYIVFISVSVGMLTVYYYRFAGNKTKQRLVLALGIVYLLLSFADGKRYTILTSLISIFVFISFYVKKIKSSRQLYIAGGVGGVFYLFIQAAREGNLSNFFSSYISKIGIGVEFRDYMYTVNNFQPGGIRGYNYELSSIGSIINSKLAGFLELDKEKMSAMGSAYTWKNIYFDLFGTEFGIRTGLFSELYFAYSFWGILVLALFSLFLCFITSTIENRSKSPFETILFAIMYALFALLIVGQSTALLGQTVLLVYLWLGYKILMAFKRN